MYAVVKVGGRQERVEPGDVIEVDFMKADPGDTVDLDPIVVFDDDGKAHVGKGLSKAKVKAKLLGEQKGEKVRVFKYRPKSGYRRSTGHRQLQTLLEIQEVSLSPQQKSTATEAKRVAAPPPNEPVGRKTAKATKSTAKKAPAKKTAARKKTTAKKRTSRKKST